MPVTRRSLINAMAKLGGAGAVYETLALWDFLKPPPAMAASLELPLNSGNGKTVAILGAGVAGLCAAYELDQAGYDCIILEAARRAGGRSLTLRRGDSFRELGHDLQTCAFDEGLYLNAGPGRIPHHHVQVIDYCRKFGVALQPYIFASRANLVHTGYLGTAAPCRCAARSTTCRAMSPSSFRNARRSRDWTCRSRATTSQSCARCSQPSAI
jgi:monoamine oxidase